MYYSRSSKILLQRHCRAAAAARHLPCQGHGSAQPPSTSTPSGNASMRRKSMAAEPSRRPNHVISSPCTASRERWRCVSCYRRIILIPTLEFSPRPDEVRISILLFLLTIPASPHFNSISTDSSNNNQGLPPLSRNLLLTHATGYGMK